MQEKVLIGQKRYIPLKDTEGLREAGFPYTRKYIYKLRSEGKYPALTAKVNGVVVLNVGEIYRLAEESLKRQKKRARLINR